MKLSERMKEWFGSTKEPLPTQLDDKILEDALKGKTIEKVTQVPTEDGWLVVYLKMTDGTSIHFAAASKDYTGRIRVQLNGVDGKHVHLPIKKED